MTQKNLAKKAGISQPTISDLENDQNPEVSAQTLLRVAAALETNPVWLWGGTGPRHLSMSSDVNDLLQVFADLTPESKAALIAAGKALSMTHKVVPIPKKK